MLEIDVALNKEMPLSQIRTLKGSLSNKIKKEFPEIFKVLIFAQAQEKKTIRIAVPIENNEGVNSKIFDHFGEAPYFAFLEFKEDIFEKLEIISNKFIEEEKRKGLLISDWLSSLKIDKIYTKKELQKGPKLVFSNSFVELKVVQLDTLKEVIYLEEKNE